jgi:hypothetical protein
MLARSTSNAMAITSVTRWRAASRQLLSVIFVRISSSKAALCAHSRSDLHRPSAAFTGSADACGSPSVAPEGDENLSTIYIISSANQGTLLYQFC